MYKTLLIVESYTKCKKIESFLDSSYKVFASLGHVRELISLKDIDIENNFNPKYSLISDNKKAKHLENMRKEIKNADEVILATDDDREGESIAWHICMLFELPIDKTKRIVFHEITENAIKNSLLEPRFLNMDLIFSQQSRQILDLLLGYSITPMLWNFLNNEKSKNLSAGRCQTPALKIIYDNYIDFKNSSNKEVYNTIGYFTSKLIPFELNKNFENKNEMKDFLEKCINFVHSYSFTNPQKKILLPPEPLITSKLLQLCSIELNLSPKETMKICQKLYEEGYITYLRTETRNYSLEFIGSIKLFIKKEYNEGLIRREIELLGITIGAHEAIRPTNIYLKNITDTSITPKEKKVYKLIWETTLESCMINSEYYSITAKFTAPDDLFFSHNSELITVEGWKKVKNNVSKSNNYNYLQTIKDANLKKIISKISLVNSKTHLTEANLVKILEEKGIGRPSTYSTLVEKIKDREYVKIENVKGVSIECDEYNLEDKIINEIKSVREFGNEKNKIIIQELGIIVIEFLIKNFSEIFNYEYTRNLEIELDKISNGEIIWYKICRNYYKEISDLCDKIIKENKENKENKEKYIKKQLKETSHILGQYDEQDLILKKGKYGLYVMWGDNQKSLSCFGNRPIENISYNDVLQIINNENTNIIRIINDNISIKNGKYGDYVYYKTKQMKKPSFIKLNDFNHDYNNCNIDIIHNWVLYKTQK